MNKITKKYKSLKKNIISSLIAISFFAAMLPCTFAENGAEAVCRLMAARGNGEILISWINKDTSECGKMELLDTSENRIVGSTIKGKSGVTVLNNSSANKINISSEIPNYILITGLENNIDYSYKLKITTLKGVKNEYIIECAASLGDQLTAGWNIDYNDHLFVNCRIENDEAAEEANVLFAESNQNENFNGAAELTPELSKELEIGQEYIFGGEVKSVNSDGLAVKNGSKELERVGSGSSEWTDFELKFKADENSLKLLFDKGYEAVYLDNLYLYKTNFYEQRLGINLIKNPGFEGMKNTSEDDKEADGAVNLFAVGRDKSLTVSWKNPNRSDIDKLSLYNEDGELLADSGSTLSKDANAANGVLVSSLGNNRRYRFKLEIKYNNGKTSAQTCTSNRLFDYAATLWGGFPTTQRPYGWKESVSKGPANKFIIQSDTVRSGKGALLVQHNIKTEGNRFSMLGADLKNPLSQDKTYRASFYVKSVNSDGKFSAGYAVKDGLRWVFTPESTGEWKKITLPDIKGVTQTFMFIIESPTDGLYIDDVDLREVDDNGNVTGENLLVNGDFEHEYGFYSDSVDKLQKLLEKCEKKNIAVDYELAQTMILESFTDYFQRDLESGLKSSIMEYNSGKFYEYYEKTLDSLNKKLRGEKTEDFVPRYITGDVSIEGSSFIGTAQAGNKTFENRPLFFMGYVGWDKARKDLNIFNDFGLNIIQTEIGVRDIIVEADNEKGYSIDISGADEILKTLTRAEKYNMKVDLLISPHYMPDFVYELEPSAKLADSGFIKYDVTNDKIREILSDYINALIPLVMDYKSLNSICLTNEPAFHSVRAANIEKVKNLWGDFLKNKYKTIENYNSIYSKEYSDFSEISMPMKASGNSYAVVDNDDALYNDYIMFNNSVMVGFHKFLADSIKKIAPQIPLHCKFQSYFWLLDARGTGNGREITYRGNDYEMLADFLDINGSDSISQYWPSHWERDYEKSMLYDIQRSVKKAPAFNSEEHLQFDGYTYVGTEVEKQAYTDLWQGAIHGRGASTVWVYERSQSESQKDMYMNVLSRPDVMSMISKVSLDLNRLAPEVTALQNEDADIAILYSKYSRNLNITMMSTIYTLYKLAMNSGLKVDFVTEDKIDNINKYPLLAVPNATCVSGSTINSIYSYSNNGGKVLLLGSSDVLLLDENEKKPDVSSDRYAKYSEIKKSAYIILTKYTGPSIVSENGVLAKFRNDVLEYFRNNNLQTTRLLKTDDRTAYPNIEWEDASYNGDLIINAVNYSWDNDVDVDIYQGEKQKRYVIDLLTGEKFDGSVTLYSHKPRLLKVVENLPDIETEDVVFIQKGERVPDVSGASVTIMKKVKNNTDTAKNITLSLGVYKNKNLVGIFTNTKLIQPSEFCEAFDEIRLDAEMPVMEKEYSYKIMCWDEDQSPIGKAEERKGE